MSELLDELARTLVQPMPRRRALGVLGAAVVGLWTGGVARGARRPLGTQAHWCHREVRTNGWKYCQQETQACFPACCPRDWTCSKGKCGSNGCCEWACCDPCNPRASRPNGAGGCAPGPVSGTCDGCKAGEQKCGRDKCCERGEFCASPERQLCCKRGERACGDVCCAPNEECHRIRVSRSSTSVCERRCPPGQAWCGRNKCCPRGWRCANERTGLCKRCQENEEECGTKCCNRSTSRCCGENLCCRNGRACCTVGGRRTCCPPRTKCAEQILPGQGGLTRNSPRVCCPTERYNRQPALCCPPGEIALNSPGLVVGPGLNPFCCRAAQVCRSGSGITCCQRGLTGTQTCCAGRCVDMQFDPMNCGSCGNVCASGVCSRGVCALPRRRSVGKRLGRSVR